MTKTNPYLDAVDDGLPMRSAQAYVDYKLKTLEHYLHQTNTAMHKHPWRARYYLDLQAGPGKNRLKEDGSIILGSPLLALNAPFPPDKFVFNELDPKLNEALKKRVSESPLAERVSIHCGDLNGVVDTVCREIAAQDAVYREGFYSCFNIAFLDPEGLELEWTTVERLARMKKMDLIINFSTGGLKRSIGRRNLDAVDRFFGTPDWRQVWEQTRPSMQRRAIIDFYRRRLEAFGYYIDIDPELGGQYMAVNNSKNVELYSLIFASKNPLGDKFWRQSTKSAKPPTLFD